MSGTSGYLLLWITGTPFLGLWHWPEPPVVRAVGDDGLVFERPSRAGAYRAQYACLTRQA